MTSQDELNFQIGKNGLTDGVIEALRLISKHHKKIRISVLKSSGRDRNSIKSLANEIISKLGKAYTLTKIIGFTILIRRHGMGENVKLRKPIRPSPKSYQKKAKPRPSFVRSKKKI